MSLVLEFLLLGVIAAALIGGFMVLKARYSGNIHYRNGLILGIVGAFLLFWINGAVGIIGSSNNDANMLYVAMLGLGLVASLAVRFKPEGLVKVLYGMVFLQVAIPVVAILGTFDVTQPGWNTDVAVLTAVFCVIWFWTLRQFSKAAEVGVEQNG